MEITLSFGIKIMNNLNVINSLSLNVKDKDGIKNMNDINSLSKNVKDRDEIKNMNNLFLIFS